MSTAIFETLQESVKPLTITDSLVGYSIDVWTLFKRVRSHLNKKKSHRKRIPSWSWWVRVTDAAVVIQRSLYATCVQNVKLRCCGTEMCTFELPAKEDKEAEKDGRLEG